MLGGLISNSFMCLPFIGIQAVPTVLAHPWLVFKGSSTDVGRSLFLKRQLKHWAMINAKTNMSARWGTWRDLIDWSYVLQTFHMGMWSMEEIKNKIWSDSLCDELLYIPLRKPGRKLSEGYSSNVMNRIAYFSFWNLDISRQSKGSVFPCYKTFKAETKPPSQNRLHVN